MSDVGGLYEIIHDAIEEMGDYSYLELIGLLETIKVEIMEEYFGEANHEGHD